MSVAVTWPTPRVRLVWAVLAIVGMAATVVFSVAIPYFLSVDNLLNILNDVALAGIVAMPAVFLLMSGQVDLSVGAAAAFVGIVLADVAPDAGPVPAVLLAALTGIAVGLTNGLVVTVGAVPSLATTFATMSLLRGLAYLVPSGLAIAAPGFRALGTARPVLGIALPTLTFAVVVAAAAALSISAVGRRSRRIGHQPVVDRLTPTPAKAWVIGLFIASALGAAVVGLIRTSQLGTGLPTAAIGLELTVLTAVLLGGARLAGGHGSVGGTLLALTTMAIIDNGLSLANFTPYAGQVLHASLLLIALLVTRTPPRQPATGPPDPAP